MPAVNENYIQFFTAVCYDWLSLLKSEEYKNIIINALQYRVKTKQATIGGFVIMPNHIHIIWRIAAGTKREDFQNDLLKITGKGIIDILSRTEPDMIKKITVDLKDRKLQVWKRNSMSIDLYNEKFLLQKLNYIHNNPCQPKWELVAHPHDYLYSSAKYYYNRNDPFQLLKHYADI